MTKPISRFPTPKYVDLPEDIRIMITEIEKKTGFIPNVFLTLAHRPDEFRAFFSYYKALMERPSGLSTAEKEMIIVVVSSANHCHYCVIAHGAVLRIRARDPQIADQLAINYHKAALTPKQKAMLDFALKVSKDSSAIGDTAYQILREHGFCMEDIWDITSIVALFELSNRLANSFSMDPNDEFYIMGRGLN